MEMPLPKHTELRYWECYAKALLENYFPQTFQGLCVKDKPDLQSSDGAKGIEVTWAKEEKQMKAESHYVDISYGRARNKEKAIEEIEKCGAQYNAGILVSKGEDSFVLILNSLEKKLETINKGHYHWCSENYLLVLSQICADTKMKEQALQQMRALSQKYDTSFGKIYVSVPEEIYVFDIEKNACSTIAVSRTKQFEMARQTRELVAQTEKDSSIKE